jgi:hypothetical protein
MFALLIPAPVSSACLVDSVAVVVLQLPRSFNDSGSGFLSWHDYTDDSVSPREVLDLWKTQPRPAYVIVRGHDMLLTRSYSMWLKQCKLLKRTRVSLLESHIDMAYSKRGCYAWHIGSVSR